MTVIVYGLIVLSQITTGLLTYLQGRRDGLSKLESSIAFVLMGVTMGTVIGIFVVIILTFPIMILYNEFVTFVHGLEYI